MEENKKVKKRRRHKPPTKKTQVLFSDPLLHILFEYRFMPRISIKDLLRLRVVCKHWLRSILYLHKSVWKFKSLEYKYTIEERIKLLREYISKGWKILPNRSFSPYSWRKIRDLKPPINKLD